MMETSTDAELKNLYDRQAAAMRKRPTFALGSGKALVHTRNGLCCDVVDNQRAIVVDLPREEGGTATAAHPGQLMRASLGACLALGYRLWGARLGVAIAAVSIEVTCQYDARGQMGVAEVPSGWQAIDFAVTLTSDAPEADLRRVVEQADRLSPMLANLSRDVKQTRTLTIMRATDGVK